MEEFLSRFAKVYSAGEVIFKEGEEGKTMFFIKEGEVQIKKRAGKKDRVLAVFTKGDFFGEISMLTGKPRSASAVAKEDSILIEIDKDKFEAILKENPKFGLEMIKKMAERLYRTDLILENLLFRDEESQIINALLQMAKEQGYSGREAKISLDLEELEARVSIEPQIIKTILHRLEEGGFLHLGGSEVKVPNLSRLSNYLNFLEWKEDLRKKIYPFFE